MAAVEPWGGGRIREKMEEQARNSCQTCLNEVDFTKSLIRLLKGSWLCARGECNISQKSTITHPTRDTQVSGIIVCAENDHRKLEPTAYWGSGGTAHYTSTKQTYTHTPPPPSPLPQRCGAEILTLSAS